MQSVVISSMYLFVFRLTAFRVVFRVLWQAGGDRCFAGFFFCCLTTQNLFLSSVKRRQQRGSWLCVSARPSLALCGRCCRLEAPFSSCWREKADHGVGKSRKAPQCAAPQKRTPGEFKKLCPNYTFRYKHLKLPSFVSHPNYSVS